MKGNTTVKEYLQRAISSELAAISQYFLHAEMQENQGFKRIAAITKGHSRQEMGHAEKLLHRLLYLDGKPDMSQIDRMNIGANLETMHNGDLSLEYLAVKLYNDAINAATQAGDNGSRELFESILKDEEDHVDYLEAQINLIGEMGYENYAAQMMGD